MLETQVFAAPVLLAALDLHERGVMKFQVPPGGLVMLAKHFLPRAVFEKAPGDELLVCEGTTCRLFVPEPPPAR